MALDAPAWRLYRVSLLRSADIPRGRAGARRSPEPGAMAGALLSPNNVSAVHFDDSLRSNDEYDSAGAARAAAHALASRVLVDLRFDGMARAPAPPAEPPLALLGPADFLCADESEVLRASHADWQWLQRRDTTGGMLLHVGARLAAAMLCSHNTPALRDRCARVLAALEAELSSLARPLSFRSLGAGGAADAVFADLAAVMLMLDLTGAELPPYWRAVPRHDTAERMRGVVDSLHSLGVCPAWLWSAGAPAAAEGASVALQAWLQPARAATAAATAHVNPTLDGFAALMACEVEREARGAPSLWGLSLAEIALFCQKDASQDDVVRFFRLLSNLGVVRLERNLGLDDVVVAVQPAAASAAASAALGEAADGERLTELALARPLRFFTVGSIVAGCVGCDCADLDEQAPESDDSARRARRTRVGALLGMLEALLASGALRQVELAPRLDTKLFARDCTLAGVDAGARRRLRLVARHAGPLARLRTLAELVALANLREGLWPPLTRAVLLADLMEMDRSLSWRVRHDSGAVQALPSLALESSAALRCRCALM